MAEDPLSELMRAIAEGFTPVALGQQLAGSSNKPAKNKPAGPPINQRLPRIVPDGKGNLIDLNTNKPVGRVGQAMRGVGDKVNEFIETASAPRTDMMAKYLPELAAERERSKGIRAENPLLDMILQITDASFGQPGDNKTAGILGPIRTQAQKQIVKGIFRADPEVLEQMRKSLKQFNIRAPGVGAKGNIDQSLRRVSDPVAGSYGVHQQVNPVLSEITIHPNTLRGKSPSGQIYGQGRAGIDPDLPATALHEGLHGFNTPLANETPLKSARKIVDMLSPELSPAGQGGVMEAAFGGGSVAQATSRAMKEALSYLGETALRGGGGPNAKAVYTAMKPPMFESAERNAQDYINQLLQQLTGGK